MANLLQYSGLENSMDYEVHGVAKSQTQLSDFRLTLSSKGLTIQFPFIFLIPFKSLCWHIFLKNVYIYVFEYIHIYLYMYICVCVCVYMYVYWIMM